MILKIKALVLAMSLFIGVNQYKNACKIYKQKLTIIKDRLNNKACQNLGEVNKAIDFFEGVTGIKSHSNGNYFGRYYPTQDDYKNWSDWLKANKSRLYWDDKEQVVKAKPLKSEGVEQ